MMAGMTYRSPLLSLPGAADTTPERGVAWHYGNPLVEQRAFHTGAAAVDLSHTAWLKVTGADTLTWLNTLLSQKVDALPPNTRAHALILDAAGHIEHVFIVLRCDSAAMDGTDADAPATPTVFLGTNPAAAEAALTYLQRMVFWSQVSVEPVPLALVALRGPDTPAVIGRLLGEQTDQLGTHACMGATTSANTTAAAGASAGGSASTTAAATSTTSTAAASTATSVIPVSIHETSGADRYDEADAASSGATAGSTPDVATHSTPGDNDAAIPGDNDAATRGDNTARSPENHGIPALYIPRVGFSFAMSGIPGTPVTTDPAVSTPQSGYPTTDPAAVPTPQSGGSTTREGTFPASACGVDLLVPRAALAGLWSALIGAGAQATGLMAWEAERVAAGQADPAIDLDDKTIPHEVPGLVPAEHGATHLADPTAGPSSGAVHLHKGCYRGQETVSRIHNLGRPPRYIVRLQLDGSASELPTTGSKIVMRRGQRDQLVGRVGTVVDHFEEGPVALGLVTRRVVEKTAAGQLPSLAVGETAVALDLDGFVFDDGVKPGKLAQDRLRGRA